MTIFEAILLGIVQGLTEFLPISSSAHLVFVPYLLRWQLDPESAFAFNVLVQMGTLLAVNVYFRRDLSTVFAGMFRALLNRRPFATPEARLGWYLILATIPAGIAGLLVKDLVEAAFNSPAASAVFLLITAGLLIAAERLPRPRTTGGQVNALDALVMGCMQAATIFPGISRSGATIAGGLFRGLERRAAARFSFLMSIPIMIAAGLHAFLGLTHIENLDALLPVILVGFLTAAVVGYLSIHWLLGYLQKHSLSAFAGYCAAAGALVLAVTFLR
jgi:undecaprenyl-diphosphatase